MESDLVKLRIAHDIRFTEEEVRAWLKKFCAGDLFDPEFRRNIIDVFINSVYLYDDRVIIFYNIKGGKQVSYIDVAAALDAAPDTEVSDFITNAPPTKKPLSHNGSRVFLYALCQKLGCAGFAAWKMRARKLEKLRKPKAARLRALIALLHPSVKALE